MLMPILPFTIDESLLLIAADDDYSLLLRCHDYDTPLLTRCHADAADAYFLSLIYFTKPPFSRLPPYFRHCLFTLPP